MSCGGGDDDDNQSKIASNLVGKWSYESSPLKPLYVNFYDCYIIFHDDGTCEWYEDPDDGINSGKYTVSGNTLRIYINDTDMYWDYTIKELTSRKLVISTLEISLTLKRVY